MRVIRTIFFKELIDTLRDRRTLAVMILFPMLLMPLMLGGMGKFVEWQEKSLKYDKVNIAISGGNKEIIAAFSKDKSLKIKKYMDPVAQLRKEKVKAAVVIPKDFKEKITKGGQPKINIYSSSADMSSAGAAQKISVAIGEYSQVLVSAKLQELKINPLVLEPLKINMKNVASKEEMGGQFIGYILPMMLVMWALIGGMYTAIDLSAGEKERRTLEALLLTPAKRTQIVMGKFVTVFIISITTMVMATVSTLTALKLFPVKIMGMETGSLSLSMPLTYWVGGIALSLLLAASFSALMLALCIFAKSFKEGQNYLTPLYTVLLIPIMVLSVIPKMKLSVIILATPAMGTIAIFKEMFSGKVDWYSYTIVFFSSLIFVAATIAITIKVFNSEKVLLRQ